MAAVKTLYIYTCLYLFYVRSRLEQFQVLLIKHELIY